MNTLKTTVATIGLIAGLCTAAQPIPRAHAESARREVCYQWLSVVNNERYDAAMRQYAAQTIRDCGFTVSYGGRSAAELEAAARDPTRTPGYAPSPSARADEVPLKQEHGTHTVPVRING